MIPKYPYEVVLFPREGGKPVHKVCETPESALAIKQENIGKRQWRKIKVLLVIDESDGTWKDKER